MQFLVGKLMKLKVSYPRGDDSVLGRSAVP